MAAEKKYKTFKGFYPYYLLEHSNNKNRVLHFIGTALLIIFFLVAFLTQKWFFLILVPFTGYLFAWLGHFFIEKNKPATFTYPLYSLRADFLMFWHILSGQINLKIQEAKKSINI